MIRIRRAIAAGLCEIGAWIYRLADLINGPVEDCTAERLYLNREETPNER